MVTAAGHRGVVCAGGHRGGPLAGRRLAQPHADVATIGILQQRSAHRSMLPT
jgi:hypothetical protein